MGLKIAYAGLNESGTVMKRREFMKLIGCTAGAWPLAVRAQQPSHFRRVGVLIGVGKEAVVETSFIAFRQTLRDAGWIEGQTIHIDERWAAGDLTRVRDAALELDNLRPDVILAFGVRALSEQRKQSPTVPLVFIATIDLAHSLARPEGQTTGFLLFEFSVIGKLLDAVKAVSPQTVHVGVLINPENQSTALHEEAFKTAAGALGLLPSTISIRSSDEIEPALRQFATEERRALILPPDVFMVTHRSRIVTTAVANGLLLLSAQRQFVDSGGLLSYGVDEKALLRQASSYVDRILRGAKPGELPIQAPTRFELVINQRTAKLQNLRVPGSFLSLADEVLE